ncbi:MAG TPA: FAD-dependent oxidoreductase [Planctomycetota bacterium]|nr:FAD-dependent oxidoreductase [Planctomycetota bacterium]
MATYDVIVVGAGLAGLSAGMELASKRHRVVILESRHVVGGRTSSWIEDGMPVESGFHRMLGFYKNLRKLIKSAGLSIKDVVSWQDELEFRTTDGGPAAVFGAAPVAHPLKTISGVLGNNAYLSAKAKASLTKFYAKGLAAYLRSPEALDKISIAEYAKRTKLNRQAVERILRPLTAGVLFQQPENFSAFTMFSLVAANAPRSFRSRIGLFKGGMTEVMTGPIGNAIEQNGGEVRTSSPVRALLVRDGRVVGVQTDKDEVTGRHVIIATTISAAQQLLKPHFGFQEWCRPMLSLPSMPAVTIQLELSERSMPVDRTSFGVACCLASFAEQSATTFRNVAGRLSIILSPPERFLSLRDEDVLQEVKRDARRLGINLEGKIVRYRVIRQPSDFYSIAPNNQHLRPHQKTPIEGLTLAGDYTRQKFLTTMEGAVVSGKKAAQIVLKALK